MIWTNLDQYLTTADFFSGEGSAYFPPTLQSTDVFPESDIPLLDFTSDFTIEFFAREKDSASATSPLEIVNETTDVRLRFQISGIPLIGWTTPTSGAGEQLTGIGGITWQDRWLHMAVSYVASSNRFYFLTDGKSASKTDGISDGFSTLGVNKVRLGTTTRAGLNDMDGYVDCLRISQEALYTTSTYTVPDPSAWSVGGNVLYYENFESPPLQVFPGPINIRTKIGNAENATNYRVTYQASTGGQEITAATQTTSGTINITPLASETEYIVRVYVDSGAGFQILDTLTTTTLANDVANYTVDDFKVGDVFSLNKLDAASSGAMSQIFNDLFTTGDKIELKVGSKSVTTDFVKRGESASVQNASGLLLPFDPAAGASQTVSLELSDTSTVSVNFDELSNTITIGAETYSPGTAFILDNKKVVVADYT